LLGIYIPVSAGNTANLNQLEENVGCDEQKRSEDQRKKKIRKKKGLNK